MAQIGLSVSRSRGGLSAKIRLKTGRNGDLLGFCLTSGEANDSPHFETLLDLGPDITPRAAAGHKGYDAKANRQAISMTGILRLSRIDSCVPDAYSITSSVLARRLGGTVMFSILAVLRLMIIRNLVASWIGRSPARSPLMIRST